MADSMPNYHVEQQRLKSQIASLNATVERQVLEVMEMEDRIERSKENIEASRVAIAEAEGRLVGLIETHGKPGDDDTDDDIGGRTNG